MKTIDVSMATETIGGYFIERFYTFLRLALPKKEYNEECQYIGCPSDGGSNSMFIPMNVNKSDLEAALDLFEVHLLSFKTPEEIQAIKNSKSFSEMFSIFDDNRVKFKTNNIDAYTALLKTFRKYILTSFENKNKSNIHYHILQNDSYEKYITIDFPINTIGFDVLHSLIVYTQFNTSHNMFLVNDNDVYITLSSMNKLIELKTQYIQYIKKSKQLPDNVKTLFNYLESTVFHKNKLNRHYAELNVQIN